MKSATAEISWSHNGADFLVTVSFSGAYRKRTYGQPEEFPELEVENIVVDGEPGPVTDDLYAIAQEDSKLYEDAMEYLSAMAEDDESQTTLRSLRGIEPDRLNGEHPADFVERLRDEW